MTELKPDSENLDILMMYSNEAIIAYTDASYCNKTKAYGCAFFINGIKLPHTEKWGGVGIKSSVEAEIEAIKRAISFIKKNISIENKSIIIQSDCIAAMKNPFLFKLNKAKSAAFLHVKSHTNNKNERSKCNDMVDKIAHGQMVKFRQIKLAKRKKVRTMRSVTADNNNNKDADPIKNSDEFITVFTDGSYCEKTNAYGCSYHIISKKGKDIKSWGGIGIKNSMAAEVEAIEKAIEFISNNICYYNKIVVIQSDCIAAMENVRIDKISKAKHVHFKHVRSHTKNKTKRTYINRNMDKRAYFEMRKFRLKVLQYKAYK